MYGLRALCLTVASQHEVSAPLTGEIRLTLKTTRGRAPSLATMSDVLLQVRRYAYALLANGHQEVANEPVAGANPPDQGITRCVMPNGQDRRCHLTGGKGAKACYPWDDGDSCKETPCCYNHGCSDPNCGGAHQRKDHPNA